MLTTKPSNTVTTKNHFCVRFDHLIVRYDLLTALPSRIKKNNFSRSILFDCIDHSIITDAITAWASKRETKKVPIPRERPSSLPTKFMAEIITRIRMDNLTTFFQMIG